MDQIEFDKLKKGQVWSSEIDGTILWIVRDQSNFEEEDAITVHRYSTWIGDHTLKLNITISQGSWYTIGYEDIEGFKISEEPKKLMIWAIFNAKDIQGKITEWKF
jgi:hypothetical protein